MYVEFFHPYDGLRILTDVLNATEDAQKRDLIQALILKELIAVRSVQEELIKDYLKPDLKTLPGGKKKK